MHDRLWTVSTKYSLVNYYDISTFFKFWPEVYTAVTNLLFSTGKGLASSVDRDLICSIPVVSSASLPQFCLPQISLPMHSRLGFPAGALWYRRRQIESRGVSLEGEAVAEVAQQRH